MCSDWVGNMSDYSGPNRRSEDRELQQIAERAASAAANKAIHDTFRLFGVDTDSQESVNDFRSTIVFAQEMKKSRETILGRAVIVVVTLLCGGAVMTFWDGIKAKVGG